PGLLLHLPDRGLDDRLAFLERAGDELLEKRIVVAGGESARTKLVDEHDLVPARVVAEHADGVAARHGLPRDRAPAAAVPVDRDHVAVQRQETGEKSRDALDRRLRLAGHGTASSSGNQQKCGYYREAVSSKLLVHWAGLRRAPCAS